MLEDQERSSGDGDNGDSRPRVEESRYVMALDFTVRATELIWQDDGQGTEEERESRRERVERLGRLLRVLLQGPGALHEFMIHLVTDRVCGHEGSDLARVFGVKGEDVILEPAISRLDEEDARFFREAAREGRFADETRELRQSFMVDWTWASVFQVGWETEGDTAEAGGRWGPEVRRLEELIRERRRSRLPEASDNLR